MNATIQSKNMNEFYCIVERKPVLELESYKVYKLVDSAINNDINTTVKGVYSGTYRHIAIDVEGTGYLFDMENSKLDAKVGPCGITFDK